MQIAAARSADYRGAKPKRDEEKMERTCDVARRDLERSPHQ